MQFCDGVVLSSNIADGCWTKKNHNRHKNIVRQFVGDCAFGS